MNTNKICVLNILVFISVLSQYNSIVACNVVKGNQYERVPEYDTIVIIDKSVTCVVILDSSTDKYGRNIILSDWHYSRATENEASFNVSTYAGGSDFSYVNDSGTIVSFDFSRNLVKTKLDVKSLVYGYMKQFSTVGGEIENYFVRKYVLEDDDYVLLLLSLDAGGEIPNCNNPNLYTVFVFNKKLKLINSFSNEPNENVNYFYPSSARFFSKDVRKNDKGFYFISNEGIFDLKTGFFLEDNHDEVLMIDCSTYEIFHLQSINSGFIIKNSSKEIIVTVHFNSYFGTPSLIVDGKAYFVTNSADNSSRIFEISLSTFQIRCFQISSPDGSELRIKDFLLPSKNGILAELEIGTSNPITSFRLISINN